MTNQEYTQAIDQAYRQYVTLFEDNAPQDEQDGQFARYMQLREGCAPAVSSPRLTGLAAFFQAVAMLASQEVDPLTLDWETANEWRDLQDAWELAGGQS